jgi:hypothetical protein
MIPALLVHDRIFIDKQITLKFFRGIRLLSSGPIEF